MAVRAGAPAQGGAAGFDSISYLAASHEEATGPQPTSPPGLVPGCDLVIQPGRARFTSHGSSCHDWFSRTCRYRAPAARLSPPSLMHISRHPVSGYFGIASARATAEAARGSASIARGGGERAPGSCGRRQAGRQPLLHRTAKRGRETTGRHEERWAWQPGGTGNTLNAASLLALQPQTPHACSIGIAHPYRCQGGTSEAPAQTICPNVPFAISMPFCPKAQVFHEDVYRRYLDPLVITVVG